MEKCEGSQVVLQDVSRATRTVLVPHLAEVNAGPEPGPGDPGPPSSETQSEPMSRAGLSHVQWTVSRAANRQRLVCVEPSAAVGCSCVFVCVRACFVSSDQY